MAAKISKKHLIKKKVVQTPKGNVCLCCGKAIEDIKEHKDCSKFFNADVMWKAVSKKEFHSLPFEPKVIEMIQSLIDVKKCPRMECGYSFEVEPSTRIYTRERRELCPCCDYVPELIYSGLQYLKDDPNESGFGFFKCVYCNGMIPPPHKHRSSYVHFGNRWFISARKNNVMRADKKTNGCYVCRDLIARKGSNLNQTIIENSFDESSLSVAVLCSICKEEDNPCISRLRLPFQSPASYWPICPYHPRPEKIFADPESQWFFEPFKEEFDFELKEMNEGYWAPEEMRPPYIPNVSQSAPYQILEDKYSLDIPERTRPEVPTAPSTEITEDTVQMPDGKIMQIDEARSFIVDAFRGGVVPPHLARLVGLSAKPEEVVVRQEVEDGEGLFMPSMGVDR